MSWILRLFFVSMAIGSTCAAEVVDTQPAIDRGLAALVKLQQPDGLIGEGAGISSLAGMAFLAGGHMPTRGLYKDASARCLRAVISRQSVLKYCNTTSPRAVPCVPKTCASISNRISSRVGRKVIERWKRGRKIVGIIG